MELTNLVALFVIYFISGIFTLRFLKKNGYRLAFTLYLILFAALSVYIPYVAGSRVMYRLLEIFVHERAVSIMEANLVQPIVVTMPFFTWSFVFAIGFSAFLCGSLAVLAATLIGYVRKKMVSAFREISREDSIATLSPAAPIPPERAARYIFCRYNC